jgi:hypothetical protein
MLYEELKIVHDGNERSHDPVTCKSCLFENKVHGMEAFLMSMTENERTLALQIVEGRIALPRGLHR